LILNHEDINCHFMTFNSRSLYNYRYLVCCANVCRSDCELCSSWSDLHKDVEISA